MLKTIVKSIRITESNAPLIYNIFINTSNLVDNILTGILNTNIIDHFSVFTYRSLQNPLKKPRETVINFLKSQCQ